MRAHSAWHTAITFVLALWWGSLTVVGFGVVPLLFAHMETAQAAGRMAAVLFSTQDWLAWGCGGLIGFLVWKNGPLALVKYTYVAIITIAIAMGAAAASHWLVAPHIVARENLKLWHSLGSALYLLQWLAVTGLMVLHHRARQ